MASSPPNDRSARRLADLLDKAKSGGEAATPDPRLSKLLDRVRNLGPTTSESTLTAAPAPLRPAPSAAPTPAPAPIAPLPAPAPVVKPTPAPAAPAPLPAAPAPTPAPAAAPAPAATPEAPKPAAPTAPVEAKPVSEKPAALPPSAPKPAEPAPAAKPAEPKPAEAAPAPKPAPVPAAKAEPLGPAEQRLAKLEAALSDLKDLRGLSEILSIQYNPFLELKEQPIESHHSTGDVLRHAMGGSAQAHEPAHEGPAPAPAPVAVHQAPAPAPPAPVHVPAPAAPAYVPPAAPTMAPAPTPAMAAPAHVPEQMFSEGGRFYRTQRPIGGPREAFLAMHWFTHLARGTSPAVIFLYLDYYQEAGWIGAPEHEWLVRLAHGLGERKPASTWQDFGLDAERLAKSHLRNLKFLDKLFGTTLQHGEAEYLQQTLDTLLQEE